MDCEDKWVKASECLKNTSAPRIYKMLIFPLYQFLITSHFTYTYRFLGLSAYLSAPKSDSFKVVYYIVNIRL